MANNCCKGTEVVDSHGVANNCCKGTEVVDMVWQITVAKGLKLLTRCGNKCCKGTEVVDTVWQIMLEKD